MAEKTDSTTAHLAGDCLFSIHSRTGHFNEEGFFETWDDGVTKSVQKPTAILLVQAAAEGCPAQSINLYSYEAIKALYQALKPYFEEPTCPGSSD